MSGGAEVPETLTGYSRALYSNWIWHQPLRLLIDAGEGVHLALRTNVWQPDVVALTHGHSDHVLGLPGLAGARRFGKGATTKHWTVLYPDGSTGVAAIRELIAGLWRGVEFPMAWMPIAPGQTHALGQQRTLEAFAVRHVPGEAAVGYRVLERRRRLKPEHASLPPRELEHLTRTRGRDAVMDQVQHVLFAHSGDAMPIDPAVVRDADLLVHDATFLGADERREPIHATAEEVFVVAREARVRALVINHLSVRYEREPALARIREQRLGSGFTGDTWLLDEAEFIRIQ
jgi:ribonuclease Z